MAYQSSVFDIDDETDIEMLVSAYNYLEEQEIKPRLTRNVIERDRETAEARLMGDYFIDDCKYLLHIFRKRYRMSRTLFLKIVHDIKNYTADPLPKHFDYIRVRPDATGRMSASVILKCTAVIRQLAYGSVPDQFDEYLQLAEHTVNESLFLFNMCIMDLYMNRYLRKPTLQDVHKIYIMHNNVHGFPGMFGIIDCMHWEWRNCPVSWQGQYGRGDKKYPTIMLEAVASHDLWIWHAFFGVAGANNDINVLDVSPLFDELLIDLAPVVPFRVNGVTYQNRYYLADWIYPRWASFVKSFKVASQPKNIHFKRKQEGARKDVERAFGVLQGRWGILRQPARSYRVTTISRVMYSCILLHNMILVDQKMAIGQEHEVEFRVDDTNDLFVNPSTRMQRRWIDRHDTNRTKTKELRDKNSHLSLQRNIMEHLWARRNQDEDEDEEMED